MSDATAQVAVLRSRVERGEQEFGAAVRDLAVAARRSVDPGNWVREKPVLWMTGAVAIGWWVGSRTGERRRARR